MIVMDDGGTTLGGVNTSTQQFAVAILPVFDTDGDLLPDIYETENDLDPFDPVLVFVLVLVEEDKN